MLKGPAWRPSSQLTGLSNLFAGLDVSRYGIWRATTRRGKLIICYAPKKSSKKAKQSSKGQVGQAHKFGRMNLSLSTCRGIGQSQSDNLCQQYSRSLAHLEPGSISKCPAAFFRIAQGREAQNLLQPLPHASSTPLSYPLSARSGLWKRRRCSEHPLLRPHTVPEPFI